MSLMQKLETFLVRHFGPVTMPEPDPSESVVARNWSFALGVQAGMYRQNVGGSELYRKIQDSCQFLIQNDEFNLGRFQDGHRSVTGVPYTLELGAESDDIFELEAMLLDRVRERYAPKPGGVHFRAM